MEDAVVFSCLPAGQEEPTRSAVAGHHDRDPRNDFLRMNKPAAPRRAIYHLPPTFSIYLCVTEAHDVNPGKKKDRDKDTQIMCCLRDARERRSFPRGKRIDSIAISLHQRHRRLFVKCA